jgi:hypothetical protein
VPAEVVRDCGVEALDGVLSERDDKPPFLALISSRTLPAGPRLIPRCACSGDRSVRLPFALLVGWRAARCMVGSEKAGRCHLAVGLKGSSVSSQSSRQGGWSVPEFLHSEDVAWPCVLGWRRGWSPTLPCSWPFSLLSRPVDTSPRSPIGDASARRVCERPRPAPASSGRFLLFPSRRGPNSSGPRADCCVAGCTPRC